MTLTVGLISSCAQNEYQDVQSSEILHSSPDVISLYANENERLRREDQSGGFLSLLLDGLLASDPDDDQSGYYHHERRNSSADKKEFIRNNGDALRESLRNKKQ